MLVPGGEDDVGPVRGKDGSGIRQKEVAKCCWRATEVFSSSIRGRMAGWLKMMSRAASMPWRVSGGGGTVAAIVWRKSVKKVAGVLITGRSGAWSGRSGASVAMSKR